MARPTGRYFASVIAKIRDAKKKEQIVVDEGFKVQLRQQLMTKIAAQMQPERVSWMERLAPFKSYLGVVPALALVIVAVVGISKLPIQFQSSVVVPTSGSQQDISQQTQASQQTPELALQMGPASVAENVAPSGIKTFPGRLVMPSVSSTASQGSADVLQSAPVPSTGSGENTQDVDAPQSVYANQNAASSSEASSESGVPAQKIVEQPVAEQQSSSVPEQVLQYFAFNPQQKSASVGEGNVAPVPATGTSGDAQASPSVSGSTPLTSGAVSAGSGEASVSGAVPSVAYNVEDSSDDAEQQKAQETVKTVAPSPAAMTYSTAIQKVVKDQAVTNQTETPPLEINEIAMLPAKQMDLNIFYNGNFSSDERTVLEQNLVPHLVDGREADFDYAYIYQKDPATIVIQMIYFDGNNKFYEYKVDAAGNWKLVQG